MKKLLLIAGFFSLIAVGTRVVAQDVCDRACLTGFVDDYFEALESGDAGSVPLSRNAKITLNGREMGLAGTFWSGASETVYRW